MRLTAEQLKQQVHYDPETGAFTRCRAFSGDLARTCRASGNHLCAQNDEPERSFRQIEEEANADARAIVRGVSAQQRLLARRLEKL